MLSEMQDKFDKWDDEAKSRRRNFEERKIVHFEEKKEEISSVIPNADGGEVRSAAKLVSSTSRTDSGRETKMVKASAPRSMDGIEDCARLPRDLCSFVKIWGFDKALTRETLIRT